MKLKEWGNAIWYLFHTLAYKLKQEESDHANELFTIIRRICNNLPCPKCRQHAMQIVSKQKQVKNKEEIERFVWKFHNIVNVSLKRNEMSYENYQKMYARANTRRIINHFIWIMQKNMRIPGMMIDTYHRQACVANFIEYIKKNYHKFDN